MHVGFDIHAVIQGLGHVLDPLTLMIIVLGVAGGIILGIIPGLNATIGIALMIPFTFQMVPEVGMSLLVAIYVGGISGGCVSAILIRMPGTPASVATLLDGFPMSQQGRAGEALGHAVVASFFGTVISGIFLILLAPVLANFAVKFFFADYVSVCVFALTAVAAITGSTVSRGLITALIGLLAATFGMSESDGLPRFDFGIAEMANGIGIIPALVGIFAISQLMHDAVRTLDEEKTHVTADLRRILPRAKEITSNLFNYFRSGVIGTFIGVVPALGGGPAGMIAYAQAKNAAKDPSRFGKGAYEGVIAAETANNATIGGALIIALTLGIPGDPPTAVLLGGLMIHGLEPGPTLLMNHADVIYAIYFSVFFGSFTMMMIMLGLMRYISRVVEVPKKILLPVLFVLATTAVYSVDNQLYDVVVMCGFGAIGYILERYRYPLPPFILGLLLGPLIENNFRRMLGSEGSVAPLVTSPISLTFLLMAAGSIVYSVLKRRRAR